MKPRIRVVLKALAISVVLTVIPLWVLPYRLPSLLRVWRSDIQFKVPTDRKVLYLTIDDAPSAATAEIVYVLQKHQVPATFFVIEDRVRSPDQLEMLFLYGHDLGNHLRGATPSSRLSLAEFQRDFDACAQTLGRVGGSRLFRPPSDLGTPEQMAYARSRGAQPVLGTVFPLDHWISDVSTLALLSKWLSVPGGIVILHDGEKRGRTTARTLDRLIPQMKKAGWTFERLATARGIQEAPATERIVSMDLIARTTRHVQRPLAADLASMLMTAKRIELVSLDPIERDATPSLRERRFGFAQLGSAVLKPEDDIPKLAETLKDGILASDGEQGECFDPRHALVFDQGDTQVAIVICFRCASAYIEFGDNKVWFTVTQKPEPFFDELFAAHGMKKAPSDSRGVGP